ncbi:amino acid adenylation domain-containing protein [Micromonospora sp. NPDC051296]|uniref:non-ribosomal peptide synthetase n=1 Tax=Micromonospora sp. NPDC051296 TaxID=3155046 RepID=UPI0034195BD0
MGGSPYRPDDPDDLAVTPAERRLWLLHRIAPDDPAYHVCLPIRIDGLLNVATLRLTVVALMRKHPALRFRYVERDGEVWRKVDRRANDPMALVELPAAQVPAVVRGIARRPIDLAAGPVTRWTLLRVRRDEHVLVFSTHHIVFDGASLAPLTADLTSLSAALAAGRPPPATPKDTHRGGADTHDDAPVHPPDDRDRRADDLTFWRRQMSGPPTPVSIWPPDAAPTNRPRTPAAVTYTTTLGPDEVDHLHRFARHRSATMPMVLLAGLAATIHRYTGHHDLVIGTPVSLRETPTDLARIGLRLNPLPLRLRPTPATTLDALVRQCRDTLLEAVEHRHTPFETIVDVVGPPRSPRHTPLFQVLLTYQTEPPVPRLPGVVTTSLPPPTPAAKYHLSLTVTVAADRVALTFEADAAECRADTLETFAQHVGELLRAGMGDPQRPIGALAVSGSPAAPYRRRIESSGAPGGLARLVEQTADRQPDSVAVYGHHEQVTYAALDRRANQLAHALRARGAAPEQVVGVYLPRTPDLLATLLAVVKAGVAFLPLDPDLPAHRIRLMLTQARATLLVTTTALAAQSGHRGPTLLIDAGDTAVRGRPCRRPRVPTDPANLAYVLFTSGSTGLPKGVAITQAGAVNFLRWATAEFGRDALAGLLALTSVGFDLSIFELFAPLLAGGAVVLVDRPQALPPHPAAPQATLVNTVPSVLDALIDADALPAGLRYANLAGEPLPRELVSRLRHHLPDLTVRNLYGPSEATTYVTSGMVGDGDGPPAIGREVAGARIWLVDTDGHPVPDGMRGTLLVGGPPLARGYLHRPALTAELFVPDHLGPAAGDRLYRTGDLARRGRTGTIWFLGRLDRQIKVRGVRIELEEIERVLRDHPAVRDVAVVHTAAPHERLVAFTVPGPVPPEPGELAAYLRQRLPPVMTPAAWSTLARLPRTDNGKLDRRRLAEHAARVAPARTTAVPPRSELERTIARVWCSVLDRPDVGVYDGFFDLGGNSLLLLKLYGRLRAAIDSDLQVVDLLQWPTIAALADRLQGSGSTEHAAAGNGASAHRSSDAAAGRGRARAAARRAALRRRGGEADDDDAEPTGR